MYNATQRQPDPVDGSVDVLPLVIADMHARGAAGKAKYGKPLQTFNGRDALTDAYQEALDMCMYLRQLIAERDTADQMELKRKYAKLQADMLNASPLLSAVEQLQQKAHAGVAKIEKSWLSWRPW